MLLWDLEYYNCKKNGKVFIRIKEMFYWKNKLYKELKRINTFNALKNAKEKDGKA